MDPVNYDDSTYEWNPSDNQKYNNKDSTPNSYKPNTNRKPSFKPDNIIKTIFCDGGSRIVDDHGTKHYIGSWSFYDQDADHMEGHVEDNSTNNQMELMANIKAIEYLNSIGTPTDQWVCFKLDSDYVRFGILFWVKKWVKNNWMRINKEGKPEDVKNVDLWKKLYELVQGRKIYFEHVSGHSGIEGNEKVDINCGILMDKFMKDIGLKK